MKNLNICIDIDGTITEPYYWLDSANKYFNLHVTEGEITHYSIASCLKLKEEDYLKFYEKNKLKIHSKEKLRKGVKDILHIIYESNNIYFVTARDKSLELLTKIYLKYHKIPHDQVLVLGTANKIRAAQELDCDIFIEDSYDNALQLSSAGFKVLLIDTNYNRLPLNDNIMRVYDWQEILDIIDIISKEEVV